MLPHSYSIPMAVVLVAAGLLACFAGYRLFRLVLGVYGFIVGALFASSLVAASNTTGMIVAALVGGAIGAAILFAAYFLGVVIVGAGLGAMVAQAIWASMGRDPHQLVVILFAVAGAIGAWFAQRCVLIGATALGGAWTALAGVATFLAERPRRPALSDQVWLAYPLHPAPGQRWFLVAWLALSVAGVAVQLAGKTAGKKGRKKR
ncbi:MAG: TMEM198/TM7SF3 family protein [Planctomycetes bacterium]|nr:TMEM198/TM7SF3 family protein [Planctomycetota bacterium]